MSLEEYKFISYSYPIFIAYIPIGMWGPVITYGFDCFLFLYRLKFIFAEKILRSENTPSKDGYASQFKALFIHCLFMNI